MPAGARADYETLLHDNYESPLYQPEAANQDIEVERLTGLLKVSVSDFLASARNLESPDELSVFIARRVMRQFAPSLLWITLHDIDIAHAGTFSLYVDGIRRTDRLCAEIWKMIQSEPEYAGNTSLFILPDFGRDSDEEAGGNGFQHHRTGDVRSRTTWMLAVGVISASRATMSKKPMSPALMVGVNVADLSTEKRCRMSFIGSRRLRQVPCLFSAPFFQLEYFYRNRADLSWEREVERDTPPSIHFRRGIRCGRLVGVWEEHGIAQYCSSSVLKRKFRRFRSGLNVDSSMPASFV